MEMIVEDIPENDFSRPNKKNQIDYDGILRISNLLKLP